MGTDASKPKNKTSSSVVSKKLSLAEKTHILSLREHSLTKVPSALVSQASALTTLDLSHNQLSGDPNLTETIKQGGELKTLNLEKNALMASSLPHDMRGCLPKLVTLNLGGNRLGQAAPTAKKDKKAGAAASEAGSGAASLLPGLPPSLKTLHLDSNMFTSFPPSLQMYPLPSLLVLNLSSNELSFLPDDVGVILSSIIELNLDSNMLSFLPASVGSCSFLKVLSLKSNRLSSSLQCLPPSLFTSTQLLDLSLTGNHMLKRELMTFEGFDAFLNRRTKAKQKDMGGGGDLGLCGLDDN